MTPAEARARTRFAIISATRAAGVVVMLVGIWAWHGNVIRSGGWPELGAPIFVIGMAASLIVPQLLARRWRTPRP